MTTEPIASEFYWLPCKEQRFFTRIQENELEQGMTILYKPVMTKQEEIEDIQNTIRQLQENVERLKSESPEDKFKKVDLSFSKSEIQLLGNTSFEVHFKENEAGTIERTHSAKVEDFEKIDVNSGSKWVAKQLLP